MLGTALGFARISRLWRMRHQAARYNFDLVIHDSDHAPLLKVCLAYDHRTRTFLPHKVFSNWSLVEVLGGTERLANSLDALISQHQARLSAGRKVELYDHYDISVPWGHDGTFPRS